MGFLGGDGSLGAGKLESWKAGILKSWEAGGIAATRIALTQALSLLFLAHLPFSQTFQMSERANYLSRYTCFTMSRAKPGT